MSARLFETDILFFQRLLAVAGFYTGALNGKWSAAVDTAQDAFFAKSDQIKQKMGAFDQRSESVIITLLPDAQAKARQFLKAVAGMPLTYRLLSGTRTYAEQNALFLAGLRGWQTNWPIRSPTKGRTDPSST